MSCLNPYVATKQDGEFIFLTNQNCFIDEETQKIYFKNRISNILDFNQEQNKRNINKLRLKHLSMYFNNKNLEKILNDNRLILVPCGRCNECIKENKRQWTLRNNLEYKEAQKGYFITLTYDNKHIDFNDTGTLATLRKKDFIDFMKRFRINYFRYFDKHSVIRFFACGEYGSKTFRPHYHFIIFNDLDVKLKTIGSDGREHFESELINKCWPFGLNDIQYVNEYSISYVSGYVQKKMVDNINYELLGVEKPFRTMSRKPGIGSLFFEKNIDLLMKYDGIYMKDFYDGKVKKFPLPKYFDRKLELFNKEKFEELKKNRVYCFDLSNSDLKYYKNLANQDRIKIYNHRSESL